MRCSVLIFVLLPATLVIHVDSSTGRIDDSSGWSYEHPERWPNLCKTGKRQSPINLPNTCLSDDSVKEDTSLKLVFTAYDKILPKEVMNFKNNGHTVSLVVEGYDKVAAGAPTISGSIAKNQTYQWTELHYHWPYGSTQGSEHELSGNRESIEMHLVHFNKKYGSHANALEKEDGLLVLGIFYNVRSHNNSALDPIVNQLDLIDDTGTKTGIRQEFSLLSLMPETTASEYLTYEGSLTTPPCYESVTWVLDAHVHYIGRQQLAEFQKIKHKISRYRDIQPLNGRIISSTSKAYCTM